MWVSGCFLGDAIGPCRSGYDGLTTSSRVTLARELGKPVSERDGRESLCGLFLRRWAFNVAATALVRPLPRQRASP